MAKANKLTMADMKVGDKLRLVTHDVPTRDPNGMGAGIEWENCWTGNMLDVPLGTIGVVDAITSTGIYFDPPLVADGWYGWPLSAFELVRNKKKVYK